MPERRRRRAWHVLASRHSASDPRLQAFLQGRTVAGMTNMGSALKIVRLAEGAADLYPRFGRTMEMGYRSPPCRAGGRRRPGARRRRHAVAVWQARLGEPGLRLHGPLGQGHDGTACRRRRRHCPCCRPAPRRPVGSRSGRRRSMASAPTPPATRPSPRCSTPRGARTSTR